MHHRCRGENSAQGFNGTRANNRRNSKCEFEFKEKNQCKNAQAFHDENVHYSQRSIECDDWKASGKQFAKFDRKIQHQLYDLSDPYIEKNRREKYLTYNNGRRFAKYSSEYSDEEFDFREKYSVPRKSPYKVHSQIEMLPSERKYYSETCLSTGGFCQILDEKQNETDKYVSSTLRRKDSTSNSIQQQPKYVCNQKCFVSNKYQYGNHFFPEHCRMNPDKSSKKQILYEKNCPTTKTNSHQKYKDLHSNNDNELFYSQRDPYYFYTNNQLPHENSEEEHSDKSPNIKEDSKGKRLNNGIEKYDPEISKGVENITLHDIDFRKFDNHEYNDNNYIDNKCIKRPFKDTRVNSFTSENKSTRVKPLHNCCGKQNQPVLCNKSKLINNNDTPKQSFSCNNECLCQEKFCNKLILNNSNSIKNRYFEEQNDYSKIIPIHSNGNSAMHSNKMLKYPMSLNSKAKKIQSTTQKSKSDKDFEESETSIIFNDWNKTKKNNSSKLEKIYDREVLQEMSASSSRSENNKSITPSSSSIADRKLKSEELLVDSRTDMKNLTSKKNLMKVGPFRATQALSISPIMQRNHPCGDEKTVNQTYQEKYKRGTFTNTPKDEDLTSEGKKDFTNSRRSIIEDDQLQITSAEQEINEAKSHRISLYGQKCKLNCFQNTVPTTFEHSKNKPNLLLSLPPSLPFFKCKSPRISTLGSTEKQFYEQKLGTNCSKIHYQKDYGSRVEENKHFFEAQNPKRLSFPRYQYPDIDSDVPDKVENVLREMKMVMMSKGKWNGN